MSMTREELQDSARRAFGEDGLVPDAAKSWGLVSEMGWLMMAVPEDLGGLGLGNDAAGVIHAELGRALVPGPAIAQLLVIEALASAHSVDGRDALLEQAMAGEVMTASLKPSPLQVRGLGEGPVRNSSVGGQTPPLKGRGTLSCVPDADRASQVLVVASDRIALVPLEGAKVTHRQTWDETRRLFDVTVVADGLTLATGDDAAALTDRLDAQLAFALAGDSIGAADGVLELTIEYLKTRRQFDRPLALFQALKHRIADMRIWLSAAEALFWSRAAHASADAMAMGALKAHATTAARMIAEEAIQLHGGIGVTMEHPCHLFLKRTMLNCALGGDNDRWEETAGRRALAAFGAG
ncbi:MAG: acyl-CoA dehydrogenase family protein [Novosphingobium sp.]